MRMRILVDLARTVSDYTIGTAIVVVHVLIASRLTRAMP
jgi:hypothetical protein